MKKAKGLIWGIIFIAAGVVWALSALDIVDVNLFFKGWWTMFIIVPCTVSLFTSNDKSGSLTGIVIGVLLLLGARNVISFGMIMKLIVPIIIISIGIKLIWNSFFGKKKKAEVPETEVNAEDIENVFAVFTGMKADCRGKVFRGAEINAIFGGVNYDLREAVLEPERVINATAVFGGISIFVPENVEVRVKSTSIFGGVSNKSRCADDAAEDVITLYVSALCLFGGIEIK